jgi:hypothetical protein
MQQGPRADLFGFGCERRVRAFSPLQCFWSFYISAFMDDCIRLMKKEYDMENLQPGTAPKIMPADIEDNIVSEFYFTAADGVRGESEMGTSPAGRAKSLELLTFCVLVLRNGYTVTGESACVSFKNFDAGVGRNVARANAVGKVWTLMGYELQNKLAAA